MVQVGGVYLVSKASLKPKNARFNSTPHDFEIFLERSSIIQAVAEDADSALIPSIIYNVRLCTPRPPGGAHSLTPH